MEICPLLFPCLQEIGMGEGSHEMQCRAATTWEDSLDGVLRCLV